MIKPLVAVSLLLLFGGAPVCAQESGTEHVLILPKHKPRPDLKGFAAMMIDYPKLAMRRKEEGDVRLSMCVNEKGHVSDVRLVASSGSTVLDEATLKGMAKLKYEPGRDGNGNPIDWCNPPYEIIVSWRLPPR